MSPLPKHINSKESAKFKEDSRGDVAVNVTGRAVIEDPITGQGAKVNKDGQLHVVGEAHLCPCNSTEINLGIDGVFTGDSKDISAYNGISIFVTSDVASVEFGLKIQYSKDGLTNWRTAEEYTIIAGAEKWFTPPAFGTFFRIVYTNGPDEQVDFELTTVFRKFPFKWSSHNINMPIADQDDAELVKSVITAKSVLTGFFENITSYRQAMNVNPAYVHRKIVNETFHIHAGASTTIAVQTSLGDTSITVVDATGLVIDSEIKIEEGPLQEIGILTVTNVVANVLTLDRPIANVYTTAATVEEVTTNMAVVGSLASPVIFEIDPPPLTVWQIARLLPAIITASTPDDGKFGSIPKLTNGVSLRATTSSGREVVFANWKTNGDMKLDMYDVIYSDKAPAGAFGVSGRWSFTKLEIVAELDGEAAIVQNMQVLIQDDLTGLADFRMRGQGRVFSP